MGYHPWFSLLTPVFPQAGWSTISMSSQIILCISQSQKWSLLNSVSAHGFLKSWLYPWALNNQDFAWSLTCSKGSMYVYWIDEWINELLRFISGLNFLVSKAKRRIYWLHSSHRHIKQHYFYSIFFLGAKFLKASDETWYKDKIVSFEKCFQYLIRYLCPGLYEKITLVEPDNWRPTPAPGEPGSSLAFQQISC